MATMQITAASLTAAGLTVGEWTHPKTGEVRFYVNNLAELIGLDVSRYGTGNISSARLNGEKTSNAEAGRILQAVGKAWIGGDGSIHVSDGCTRGGYEWVAADLRKAIAASIAPQTDRTQRAIMTRAWAIARAGAARFGGTSRAYFAEALRQAWAEAR